MRLALTIVVFLIVGVTLAGSLITVLLAGPFSGSNVQDMFGWIALGGFLVALPVSYFIAGYILARTRGNA
jgi:hypothetical protein